MERAADASDVKPDRLSVLPDCLLHGILSLSSMGARGLVQTSTLSRRWRHFWREAPCLDIGPHEFQGDDEFQKWVRFNNFVDSLVLQHDAVGLDALRMQVVEPPKDRSGRWSRPDGNSWVRRCLARYSPAVLDIRNQSTSGAHVQMRRVTRGTVLHHLTTLRLTGVTLCAGFEHLLGASGCPLLENLELKDCLIGFREVVASSTLKTIVVHSYNMSMGESSLRMDYTPRIVAPGLASLDLVLLSWYAPLWEFQMSSLVEATVVIDRGRIGNAFQLLCSLKNVTKLEISTFPSLHLVMNSRFGRDLPEFHNLTTLILEQCRFTHDGPTLLEFFLLLATNLEKLTLENCTLPSSSERMVERSISMKMSNHHLNLKFVEIKHRKKVGVSGIIEYLLRVSKNLLRTDIVLSEGRENTWYQAALAAQGWWD
ncbi:hypothetical protein ACQ4PT_025285 [Festuca glaucescens]